MAACPCGSTRKYSDCCEPYLTGKEAAPSAEALMRSRYTAYVKGFVSYIMDTHDPDTVEDISREATEEWSEKSEWLGLDILSTQGGQVGDREGTVEFRAKYRDENRAIISHHERSLFKNVDGRWYFSDATMVNKPEQRESPKVGRNDPCPCGSGKKYKHCCG